MKIVFFSFLLKLSKLNSSIYSKETEGQCCASTLIIDLYLLLPALLTI